MITLDINFYTERKEIICERDQSDTHTHICKRENPYFAIVFSAMVVNKKNHGNADWLGTPIQKWGGNLFTSTEARIFQLMWKTANFMLMSSSIYGAKDVINDFVACRVSTIVTLNMQLQHMHTVYIMPFAFEE